MPGLGAEPLGQGCTRSSWPFSEERAWQVADAGRGSALSGCRNLLPRVQCAQSAPEQSEPIRWARAAGSERLSFRRCFFSSATECPGLGSIWAEDRPVGLWGGFPTTVYPRRPAPRSPSRAVGDVGTLRVCFSPALVLAPGAGRSGPVSGVTQLCLTVGSEFCPAGPVLTC